jgi:hypothetical protein
MVAPARLLRLNGVWLKTGAALAKIVNPIVLALSFFLVVTPVAIAMRLLGKRPLWLAPDPNTPGHWIAREHPKRGASTMRHQF